MSRYQVQDAFDAGPFRVVDTLAGTVITTVYDDGSQTGEGMEEAEAHIIAFALNAVAAGHTIAKTPGMFPRATTMYGEVYDGPTEGVAGTSRKEQP